MPRPAPVYGNTDQYIYVEGFGSGATVTGLVSAAKGVGAAVLDGQASLNNLSFAWGTFDIKTARGTRVAVPCHRWLLEGSVVTSKLLSHVGETLYVLAWDATRADASQTAEIAIPITPLDGHVVAVET